MHDLFKILSSVLMKKKFSLGKRIVKIYACFLDEVTNLNMHSFS